MPKWRLSPAGIGMASGRVRGRRVGDGNHADDWNALGNLLGQHNSARPVFAPFFLAAPVLVLPKVGIGNDKAGMWCRQRQGGLLAEVEVVEIGEVGRNLGGCNGLQCVAVKVFHAAGNAALG